MLHRKVWFSAIALLLCACATTARSACISSCAGAGVPCTAQSTAPPVIVGTGSSPETAGAIYKVFVRDAGGAPVPNVAVTLDFTGALASTHGNAAQGPGVTLSCSGATLVKTTDAQGVVVFRPKFGGYDNAADVEVSAAGVCLVTAKCRSTDFVFDTSARVSLPELGPFTAAFLGAYYVEQYDFDNNQPDKIRLGDFAIFSQDFLNAQNGSYCTSGW